MVKLCQLAFIVSTKISINSFMKHQYEETVGIDGKHFLEKLYKISEKMKIT